MVVSCERCAAAFQVESTKIGPSGANVRCGKCGYIFFAQPQAPEAGKTGARPPSKTREEAKAVSSLADQLQMYSDSALPPPEVEPTPPPAAPSPPQRPPEKIPAHRPKPDVAPEKTAHPARKPATLSRRPFAERPLPMRQRLIHASVVALLLLLGVFFGLAAMGVRLLPRDLTLLLRYGIRSVPQDVQILTYRGRIQEIAPAERVLTVTGEILNRSGETAPAPSLRLEVFSPDGEFLLKHSFPSGADRMEVSDVTPFSTQVGLESTARVGSYKVTIER